MNDGADSAEKEEKEGKEVKAAKTDKTQRRNGNGRCIYLSKEGSKLLLRKRNIAKSMGGNIRNADGSLSNQLSNSIDRLSDHSDKRKYVAVSAANGSPNPYRANSPKLNKKRSMP